MYPHPKGWFLQGPNITGFEPTCKAEPDSDREELMLHGDIGHDIQVCVEKVWRGAMLQSFVQSLKIMSIALVS